MPPIKMTASELIRRWEQRKQEILATLDPELRTEFRRLNQAIAAAREEIKKDNESKKRTPLAVHRENLIKFLKANGQSPRSAIRDGTGIPEGSLSELLGGIEFEKGNLPGTWRLVDI